MKRFAGVLVVLAALVAVALWAGRRGALERPIAPQSAGAGERGASALTGEVAEPAAGPTRESEAARREAATSSPAVSVSPDPECTARVFVREDDAGPIAGARVTAFRGARERVVIADERGLALVPVRAEDDTVPLLVEADGYFHDRRPFLTSEDIVVRLARSATLSGRVLERESGNPVPNATVEFSHPLCRRCPSEIVRTDGTGVFHGLETLARFRARLGVSAPGYASCEAVVQLEPGVSFQELRVLRRGVRVSGLVVDSESGVPIQRGSVSSGGAAPLLALEHGRFDALFLPDDEERIGLEIAADGYCRAHCELDSASYEGAPLSFPLPRSARIHAFVHDPTGTPIIDARVSFSMPGGSLVRPRDEKGPLRELPYTYLASEGVRTFEPDGAGGYTSAGLIPWAGGTRLSIEHDDYKGTATRIDVGPPGSTTDVEVVLQPLPARGTITVHGSVTVDGAPANAGSIGWEQPPRDGAAKVSIDGTYAIEGLRPGDVALRPSVTIDGFALGPRADEHVVVVHCDDSDVERDIDVPIPMGSIAGRLVRADGSPVGGRALWIASQTGGDGFVQHTTAADGRFWFRAAADDVYQLVVWQGVTSLRRTDLRPSVEDLRVVLPDLGSLRVEVVDAQTGAPLPGAEFHLRPTEEEAISEFLRSWFGWLSSRNMESLSLADDAPGGSVGPGTTRVDLVPAHYDVVVRGAAIGYLPSEIVEATVRAGQVTEVSITLERGRDLVVRSLPDPVPPPEMLVLEAGATPESFERAFRGERVLHFAGGVARIRGLAPGDYVFATSKGSLRFEPPGVHVGPDDVTEVELAWYPQEDAR